MVKKTYIQLLRGFFIFAMLAGFNVSTLMACRCAVIKSKAAAIESGSDSCCQKTPKAFGKRCCKMSRCMLVRKHDTIVERNDGDTALIAVSSFRLINLQPKTISDKPFCRAVFAGPGAAELCVFLC